MTTRFTRRRFLTTGAAAAGLGYFYTAPATSAARAGQQPNSKLKLACIGVGGKGNGDSTQAARFFQCVAICDIDEGRLNTKANEADKRGDGGTPFAAAKKYTDYRKMLEEMGKEIDAVTVSTPDHTHAPASLMAMKMKKHVYCQKPLTHSVDEARQMRLVAKEMGVCTQMGNQGSASEGVRRAVEIVAAGVLGDVKEAHIWTDRPARYWKQAPDIVSRPEEKPVPKGLHWNEWIGVAPMRPYAPGYHPFSWRAWWDFGTGAIGDMACHTANLTYRALKLGFATSVVADARDINPETYPSSSHVIFQFPARDAMPAATVHWYEGSRDGKKLAPPDELIQKVLKKGERLANSGCMLVGSKGLLFSPSDYGQQWKLFGDGLEAAEKAVAKTLPRNSRGDDAGMKEEWFKAITEGKPEIAYSNFGFAGMLTETILLGNIAGKCNGELLQWDPKTMTFPNNKKANEFIKTGYRKDFKV